MEKKTSSKVKKGILFSKPSICTLSCSWVVVECVTFLLDKFPSIKKSFFGGGDEIPCIINNNGKLWIFHICAWIENLCGYCDFQECS